MTSNQESLSLIVPLTERFMSAVTGLAENTAIGMGLGAVEAIKLTLAVEEIFAYLIRISAQGHTLSLEITNYGYYVQAKFVFTGRDLDLRLFNLAAGVSLDDEKDLGDLGLLLASRSVDDFSLFEELHQGIGLVLIKAKSYPATDDIEPPEARPLKSYRVQTADREQVKEFSRLLALHYPANRLYPAGFEKPGRLADMIGGGKFGLVVAQGERNRIGGGMIWRQGSRIVEFYGPYPFNQPPDSNMAADLIEACINGVARTDALGIICSYTPSSPPAGYFDTLGALDVSFGGSDRRPVPFFYRQLSEDSGVSVWAHPGLADFLAEQYGRLVLPRDVRKTRHEGERISPHSVLSTTIERGLDQATLRPMWNGEDRAANISRHLSLLRSEHIDNLFFLLDTGLAWQADWTPVLLDQGFTPRLVIPYGGRADMVIFQHQSR
ncbi:MAG: hypothetical protein KKB20_12350 [Proteobacteria bacterium]|nr:hypothetical protein [Pseudomonadota bacterium]